MSERHPALRRHEVVARLEADGLLRRDRSGELRTTRRWQGAIARAALRLCHTGDSGEDLRVPIALALLEIYGEDQDDLVLAERVDAILPIEGAELDPRARLARAEAAQP